MGHLTLVTGGARSGKSRFAEARLAGLSGRPIYIATAEALDAEMAARIARHRADRPAGWRTVEEPLDLAGALKNCDGPVIVDCLTLWLSNLIHAGRDWEAATEAVLDTIARIGRPVICVTNEIGAGIVPDNALARDFRDAAGRMNQRFGGAANEIYLVVAGHPLRIKPSP